MLTKEEKSRIIDLKRAGQSTRRISGMLNINRRTISKYWNEAQLQLEAYAQQGMDERTIHNGLYGEPQYAKRAGRRKKVTPALLALLGKLSQSDAKKNAKLGWEKQKLSNVQIHQMVLEAGYDISISTVNVELAKMRKVGKHPSVYIKQYYEYGIRLEFDFGEVKLEIGGALKMYHMAVFCAPASNFRWCFLYDNQKQSAFLDSHIKFFEIVGGVWSQVFYDNMRNVVSSFGPKNVKRLNGELLKLASYYGYEVRTTSPYAGNEKGSVERSVAVLRNRLFALNHQFTSMEAAKKYMAAELVKLNAGSDIAIEKTYLKPAHTAYELAEFSQGRVSKYGYVSVQGNRYSVPEAYANKYVTAKIYYDEIRIMSDFTEIARHPRASNKGEDITDINHFLGAFQKKPGALEHSVALRALPKLREIFRLHYKDNPRKFIEVLKANKDKSTVEVLAVFEKNIKGKTATARDVVVSDVPIKTKTEDILKGYANLAKGGNCNE